MNTLVTIKNDLKNYLDVIWAFQKSTEFSRFGWIQQGVVGDHNCKHLYIAVVLYQYLTYFAPDIFRYIILTNILCLKLPLLW